MSKVHSRLDRHSCYAEFKHVNLPAMDWFDERQINLPCGWWLERLFCACLFNVTASTEIYALALPYALPSSLPGEEKVVQSLLARVDGRPCLCAVTLRSDRVGVFEKKKLRVYELAPDRTRSGQIGRAHV